MELGSRGGSPKDVCCVEFVISQSEVKKVERDRKRINDLFNVKLTFGEVFSKRAQDSKQWMSITGKNDDATSAKEYVLAIVTPEASALMKNIRFHPNFKEQDRADIERSTGAVLRWSLDNQGSLQISGSELAVVLAQSIIDELFASYTGEFTEHEDDGFILVGDVTSIEAASSDTPLNQNNSSTPSSSFKQSGFSSDDAMIISPEKQQGHASAAATASQRSALEGPPATFCPPGLPPYEASQTSSVLGASSGHVFTTSQSSKGEEMPNRALPSALSVRLGVPNSLGHVSNPGLGVSGWRPSVSNQQSGVLNHQSGGSGVLLGPRHQHHILGSGFGILGPNSGGPGDNQTDQTQIKVPLPSWRPQYGQNVACMDVCDSEPPTASSANNNNNTSPLSVQAEKQRVYLRDLGVSCNYSLGDIEIGLSRFSMEEVIIPAVFLSTLNEVKASRHSNRSVPPPPPPLGQGHVAATATTSQRTNRDNTGGQSMNVNANCTGASHSAVTRSEDVVVISSDEEEVKIEEPSSFRSNAAGLPQLPPMSLSLDERGNRTVHMDKGFENLRLGEVGSSSSSRPDLPGNVPATMRMPRTLSTNPSQASNATGSNLRYIVIDGSNVAMSHGENKRFSTRGLQICIDYFRERGHPKVVAFVSEAVRYSGNPIYLAGRDLLEKLNQDGFVKFTPARRINGRNITTYEDRLLQFVFADDHFMPPDDPLGRNGPSLDDFLMVNPPRQTSIFPSSMDQAEVRGPPPPPPQPLARYPYSRWPQGPTTGHPRGGARNVVRPWRGDPAPDMSGDHLPAPRERQGHQKLTGLSLLPGRSEEETQRLFKQLSQVFCDPSQSSCIKKVLQNHKDETDINRLTNFLLSAMDL
ncbi:uncharacterized protein LOC101863651 isoform X2 [Aplysia californica]|uniref:Uncharacterized protein LOC101863651 isoform X2 n=1 Tax=Aplysia californica TaxID=6500 RepID=A0ABM1W5E4_APLCA|nr:uncharacterized protein LOC101863651 isoform X2 [Aplysia californica]